jgi:hypothetical protein
MTVILNDCELWFAKLDPKRPSAKFNKKNPTWELQIRTTDKEQKKQWEEASLSVKAVIPDEEDLKPYYRVNLRKKSIKADGDPASPVEVVDGNLDAVNPNSIGNGSIGNIRLFQYEYPKEDSNEKGIASIMMGVQLTKHIVYKPKKDPNDEFGQTSTEVITPAEEEDEDITFEGGDKEEASTTPTPKGSSPKIEKPEDSF